MKRLAMTVLAVIVLATTLYWVPVIQAREIACEVPGFEAGQVCP
ncbi:MAG TPA: hypothetical protein VGK88_11975 [bacterium]|jgi:hypothetical protein